MNLGCFAPVLSAAMLTSRCYLHKPLSQCYGYSNFSPLHDTAMNSYAFDDDKYVSFPMPNNFH